MDELESTFELPEPTPTTAYIASKGGAAFIGCAMMPNGKVMLAPSQSGKIGIYDPIINNLEFKF